MGLERWRVRPGDKVGTEYRFILEFTDIPTPQTQPFMRSSDLMTEAELRFELKKLDASEPEIDAALAEARAKIDEMPPR